MKVRVLKGYIIISFWMIIIYSEETRKDGVFCKRLYFGASASVQGIGRVRQKRGRKHFSVYSGSI
jgi:hypothetical protein